VSECKAVKVVFPRPQPGRDRYRMIVLRTDGSQVLLVPNGTHFALPEVEIPSFERVAENITTALRREWGHEIVCLYPLRDEVTQETPHAASYYVAEVVGPQISVGRSTWVSVELLFQDSFANACDHQALCSSLARCRSLEATPKRGAFEKLGWFSEAKSWIAETLEPYGLRLRGPFRQLNASATFSLLRFETTGSAVWLKAVGKPNERELPISRELARFFPGFVPKILATRGDWNAWLSLEAEGRHPDDNSEMKIWTTVARTLADLQIASIGHTLHLINVGSRDARVPALWGLVDPFLSAMADLMTRQTKPIPPPVSQPELQALGRQLKDALAALEKTGIPNTLGNLDFNAGNWLVHADRCVFLDWAEGCVGHPFITFQYLLERTRHLASHDSHSEHEVISSYVAPWRAFLAPDTIIQALGLAPLVAVYAYAAISDGWRETNRSHQPRKTAYLRSLARRMKREADRLAIQRIDRSVGCLG
jgi:hypothetical protein